MLIVIYAQRCEKAHQPIQLLSLVEKDYSAHVKDVSLFFSCFWIVLFLFEYLSSKFLLISFICSHNNNLNRYRTMRNRRNIKNSFGYINMWGSPWFIFCHRESPKLKKLENPCFKSPKKYCIFFSFLPLFPCWLLFWTCYLHASTPPEGLAAQNFYTST